MTIYIVPKRKSENEEKKHIPLVSYSRATEIYPYFTENVSSVWTGKVEAYTPLNFENIGEVIKDFDNDIRKARERLGEYEKYAKDNPDYIDDILTTKSYIHDLEYWRAKVSFIEDMLSDKTQYNEIEEICCNVD